MDIDSEKALIMVIIFYSGLVLLFIIMLWTLICIIMRYNS
jgi:hypothetical protein